MSTRAEVSPRGRLPAWLGNTSRAARSGIVWTVVTSLLVAGCVAWARYGWTNHAPKTRGPDGSVLIGTFITLYGLFLGGFGVLAGFASKISHVTLRVMALAFIGEASILDLFRVLNSTEDLYSTTVRKLTFFQLHDNMHDFLIYFIVNLAVSAFALLTVCLP